MKRWKMYLMMMLGCVMLTACHSGSNDISGVDSEEPGALSVDEETLAASDRSTSSSGSSAIYVATSGSDANNGASAAPWRSLQHAVDNAQPGDTIWIESGTYAGFRATISGRSGARITVKPVSGASVTIDRAGSQNSSSDCVELDGVSYWTIEGLSINGGGRYGLSVIGSASQAAEGVIVRNTEIAYSSRNGLYAEFTDDIILQGNTVHDTGYNGILIKGGGDRPIVRNNRVYNNATGGIHFNGAPGLGGDGVIADATIANNTLYCNGSDGRGGAIGLDGVEDSTISGNHIYQNYNIGISIFTSEGSNGTQNNRISGNTIEMPAGSSWAVEIVNRDCTGNQVIGNVLLSEESSAGSISIPAPGLDGFSSDNNQVVNRFGINGGETIISLSQWQSFGFDSNSFF